MYVCILGFTRVHPPALSGTESSDPGHVTILVILNVKTSKMWSMTFEFSNSLNDTNCVCKSDDDTILMDGRPLHTYWRKINSHIFRTDKIMQLGLIPDTWFPYAPPTCTNILSRFLQVNLEWKFSKQRFPFQFYIILIMGISQTG
jgi:hypothetical protein